MLSNLQNLFSENKLSPILLLTGSKKTDEIAKTLAKKIVSTSKDTHPDIHEYFPQGKADLHPIESIHLFTEEMFKPPYCGAWKVFIFYEAEKMLPYSSNALLKTLEEPSSDAYVFLLASQKSSLLPTIISRSSHYHLENENISSDTSLLSEKIQTTEKLLKKPISYYQWLEQLKEIDALFQESSIAEKKEFLYQTAESIFEKKFSFLHTRRALEEAMEKAIKQIERSCRLSVVIEYLYLSVEDLSLTEVPNHPSLERRVAK